MRTEHALRHEMLLIQLHEEMVKAGSGSAHADEIRDEMDLSWYSMEPEENEHMNELSADLFIFESPIFKYIFRPEEKGKSKAEVAAVFAIKWQERGYEKVAKLFREAKFT